MSPAAAGVVAAQRGLRRAARSGRAGLHRHRRLGSLFFQCGNEVLADLHSTLANEPVSLMLTDAEGVVLSRLSGDRSLLEALDDVHLAPGFRLLRAGRRHQRPRPGAGRPGAHAGPRRPALRAEPVHLHLRRGAGVRSRSGRLEGSVNLTTWSRSSSDLLLALARSAASNTTALMLARSSGRLPRPAPRGQVFRVEVPRLEPGSGTLHDLSEAWNTAVARAERAMAAGAIVAAVGEPGVGPGHRCSRRPPATPIRAIASCRPAHPRRPTCRRGWGCGHPSSARPTRRSSFATSTCCRPGSPNGSGIWSGAARRARVPFRSR